MAGFTPYDYRKIQEARRKNLASKTNETLNEQKKSSDFIARTEALSRVYQDKAGQYITDRIIGTLPTTIKNNNRAIEGSIDSSLAKSPDKKNIYDQALKQIRSNRTLGENVRNTRKSVNEFNNQFRNRSDYDNAMNMVKYGSRTYNELKEIVNQNDARKAAGEKINESENEWIRSYANSIKSVADVDDEINDVKDRMKKNMQSMKNSSVSRFNTEQTPFSIGSNNGNIRKMNELIKENRAELDKLNKERQDIERKNYYKNCVNEIDFEDMSAKGMSLSDNKVVGKEIINIGKMTAGNPIDDLMKEETGYNEGAYMSEDEKKIYSYILAKDGNEKADEYLDYLKEDINYRKAGVEFASIAGNPVMEILHGAKNGLMRNVDAMKNLVNLTGDEARPVSKNEYLSGMISEDLKDAGPKIMGNSLGKIGYDIVDNTANMVPSMVIGNPIAGASIMGVNSGATSANEAWREHGDKNKALAYGVVNGALEGGLQYALGGISKLGGAGTGRIKDYLSSKVSGTLGKALINTGVSAAGEGTEEYLQEILDPVVRNLTLGENNEFRFVTDEALYSGFIGALTGSLMSSGENISKAHEEVAYEGIGKELSKDKINALVEYAGNESGLSDVLKEYNENPVPANAGKLKLEVDNNIGEKISEYNETGRIDKKVISNGYVAEIAKEALEESRTISKSLMSDASLSKTLEGFSDNAVMAMNTAMEGSAVDETTFKNAFANYYSYGKAGVNFDAADQMATFKDELSENQKKLAYETGKADRVMEAPKENKASGQLRYINDSELSEGITVPKSIKEMDSRQKSSIMALKTFAEVSGMDIVLYSSEAVNGSITAPNGWYNRKNNAIYIDTNAGDVGENAMLRTASHEITHSVKEWSPEKYSELQDYIVGTLENDSSLDVMIQEEMNIAKSNGQTLTYDEALDEVVANSCEMMLKDSKAIERLADESPDIFKHIKMVINKIVGYIKEAFEGLHSGSMEHKRMSEILDNWNEIQKLWDDAVVDSGKNAKKADKTVGSVQNDDIIFSARDSKYAEYINNHIVDFAEEVKNGKVNYNKKLVISESIPERLARDIKKHLDIDINFSECKNILSKNSIEHIERDHGTKGKSDHSMEDIDNIGLISYVIDNYTNIEKGKLSVENKNSDNTFADTIIMSMPYNDKYYYLVEAVPILKNKNELRVVSAYIGQKKETSQVANGKTFPVRTSESALESISDSKIAPTSNDVNKKFSLRDNTGRELSPEQAEYFKDSKVRDEGGNLKVVYHGTPYGGFTVFKNDLNYFTPSREYAERYHSPSASSIRGKYDPATREETYQVYLNIKKPFDISDAETRDIFINEYIKGGYAQGINPYLSDAEIENIIKDGIDWTEADNILEFIEDNEYDYDGIILKEGGDLLPDGSVYDRGNSYVTFNPNQVKNTDNLTPTDDEDIRFSYRADTRSNREILADALMSATKNESERKSLESYQKIIGTLDMQETLRREKVRRMKEAETAYERDKLQKEIDAIDSKIAYNDKRLIAMEAAAPLRAVVKREAKANADKDIEYIKNRYAENKKRKQMTVLRNNIKNNSSSLISLITKPTDKRHVPEGLKAPVKNFLESIDFISAAADTASFNTLQWNDRINELHRVIAHQDANENINFDPDLLERISEFVKNNAGKKLTSMNMSELEELYIIVRSLRMGISNANRMFANKRSESADKLGYQTIEELSKKKDKRKQGKLAENIDNFFNLDMIDASSYFKMMGSSAESIYNELYDGWLTRVGDIKKSGEYIDGVYDNLNITKKDIEKWTGKKAEIHEFNIGESKLELTTAQIMSLYELGKREQAHKHMFGVGVRAEDSTGKPVKLSERSLKRITDTLSRKERNFADAIQSYMANECAAQGNDTSMRLYGYRKFNEKEYFPINVYKNNVNSNNTDVNKGANAYAIINTGMTKNLDKNANTGLIVRDIFDVYTDHVVDMANYHGLSAPILDAMKWFNYKYMTGDVCSTVKEEMERAFGKEFQNYFMNLMLDINGDTSRKLASSIPEKFISSYKSAAVGANLRVVIQQPSAYVRAAASMNIKYLTKALAMKPNIKEAMDNSNLAWWKSQGYYDTGIGQSLKSLVTNQQSFKDKVVDKSMILAGKADELTWGTLWNAVKLEVSDKNKALDKNSDEFIRKVTERFERIIDETQIVDTVFAKSQIMRSKNGLHKMLTSFMAEPVKSYNMLRNAYITGDIKNISYTTAVFMVNAVATSALSSVIDAFRSLSDDDEREKEYLERYMNELEDNMIDNANPLNLIPYVKELSSLILAAVGRGYSSTNRQEVVWMENMIKSCTEIVKCMNGTSKKKPLEIVKMCTRAVSQASGIPVYNVYRDSFEVLYNEVQYKMLGKKPMSWYARKASIARMEGNISEYEKIINNLESEGYGRDEILKKVTAETTKINKSKKDAAKAKLGGNEDEYNRIISELNEEGLESARDNIDSMDVTEKEPNEKSIYKASDIASMLSKNDVNGANRILADLYKTELKNTDTSVENYKYEAFKKVKTNVKRALTKEYKNMSDSDRQKYQDMLKKLEVEKINIYTDKDIDTIEKVIKKEENEK